MTAAGWMAASVVQSRRVSTPLFTAAAAQVLRRVPTGCGEFRTANMLYRRIIYEGGPVRRLEAKLWGARLWLDLADWTQASAYLLGRYDDATVEFVCAHLPDDGCFVDGGGHVGLIGSQVAIRKPRARIYAFEPHPREYRALTRNIELNGFAGYTAVNMGLSDAEESLPFDPVSHSLEDRSGDHEISIDVTTLDRFMAREGIARIDVMKLDIQGHEPAALRGASAALKQRRIGAVAMERVMGDVDAAEAYLLEHGFHTVPWPDPRVSFIRPLRRYVTEDAGYVLA